MKLKTLSKIESVITAIIVIIAIPFALISRVTIWVQDILGRFGLFIGNKLLLVSDEVKEGKIKNMEALFSTARAVYKYGEKK
jgi:hypothetical protein